VNPPQPYTPYTSVGQSRIRAEIRKGSAEMPKHDNGINFNDSPGPERAGDNFHNERNVATPPQGCAKVEGFCLSTNFLTLLWAKLNWS
jgi:hypothetical protein